MYTYTEISNVRKRGLNSNPPDDNDIALAISIASELINSWCGQDFSFHENFEITLDGNDGDTIIIGKRIIAVTELTINENPIPPKCIVTYPGSMIGEISLIDGYKFLRGHGNVRLTANLGWETVPHAISEAAAHLAAMILNRQFFSARPEIAELDTEKLLDYTRKRFKPSDIKGFIDHDPYLVGLLRPYRLKGVLH